MSTQSTLWARVTTGVLVTTGRFVTTGGFVTTGVSVTTGVLVPTGVFVCVSDALHATLRGLAWACLLPDHEAIAPVTHSEPRTAMDQTQVSLDLRWSGSRNC
jgi:hypothetical protein